MLRKKQLKLCSPSSNGVILRIHHTIRETPEQERKLRLLTAMFDNNGKSLACSDHRGNIFIFDLFNCHYWKVPLIRASRTLGFSPLKSNQLLIANIKSDYDIQFIDISDGKVISKCSGHSSPAEDASFSTDASFVLTYCTTEAIIWELKNFTKYFILNLNNGPKIKMIEFAPSSNNIIACFNDFTIRMWNQTSLEPFKPFPSERFSKATCFAFTSNGRILAVAGLSSEIFIVNVETWSTQQIDLSKEKINSIRQIHFLPYGCDGGSNKILLIFSDACILHFYNISEKYLICSLQPGSSNFKRFICSSNGKYLACILRHGEIDVYNNSVILHEKNIDFFNSTPSKFHQSNKGKNLHSKTKKENEVYDRFDFISDQIKTCLDKDRLKKILEHFGEYPSKHRINIWGALLHIPFNREAYSDLVNRELHPSFMRIEIKFKLKDSFYLKHLKRLISSLFYWCPKLADCDFLIEFVFPFIKMFYTEPLCLFEIVSTMLVNHCQGWFEFSPLIPIGTLALIENVLGEHDRKLLCHFFKLNITTELYAWQLLKTGFSEVLSTNEWLILWDHIISNEPAFLLIAVVAYNVINRNALLNFNSVDQFNSFYIKQNPINVNHLIKKSYAILNDSKIYPRKYLRKFQLFPKGLCYPQYVTNFSVMNIIVD